MNYYNEFDPFAAAWLRKLIEAGLIPNGEVDERSIINVQPDELRGYDQCHFFAGIGGWSHALRLAGWPDDRQIWTGSCPCQPFSVAGKGIGTSDERHLWPHFFRLIKACRPAVVMGEQVAGKAGYGWFDGVRSDLEGEGYASRAVDIPACSVNAPHIRQRLYWVAMADASSQGLSECNGSGAYSTRQSYAEPKCCGSVFDMGDPNGSGQREHGRPVAVPSQQPSVECSGRDALAMADANSQSIRGGMPGEVVAASGGNESKTQERERIWADIGSSCDYWGNSEWVTGADGKSRRAQPGVRLLVNGVPNRVGRLRGYGNAIVPPLAAEVIKAFMETQDG